MIILFLHDEKTEINYAPQSFSSLRMAQRTLKGVPDGVVDWESTKVGMIGFDEFAPPESAIGLSCEVMTQKAFLALTDEPKLWSDLRKEVKGDG